MADPKTQVWIFVVAFAALAIWLHYNVLDVVKFMASSNILIATLIYLITNPVYILIVFGVMSQHQDKIIKAFFAGILITIAADIISLPRLLPGADLESISMMANLDTIFANFFIGLGVKYSVFLFLYYVVLPISLVLIAINLLGYAQFVNKIKSIGQP